MRRASAPCGGVAGLAAACGGVQGELAYGTWSHATVVALFVPSSSDTWRKCPPIVAEVGKRDEVAKEAGRLGRAAVLRRK